MYGIGAADRYDGRVCYDEWIMKGSVAAFLLLASLPAQEKMTEPRYVNGNHLVRPEGYRHWMFVGANSGMGYREGKPNPNPTFHNIFIQPEAYRRFAETGKFPDKTILVMEVVSIGTNASINRHGQFQDKLIGIEVALKDSTRFAEQWAYFDFIGTGTKPLTEAKAFPKDACWKCHNEHAASDNVFTQFYPVLREVAKAPAR